MKTKYTDEQLVVHHSALGCLHRLASGFFAAEWQAKDKTKDYHRRPNLSIRLALPGEPPARLSILPGWSKYTRQVDPTRLTLELTVARIPAKKADGTPTKLQTAELRLQLDNESGNARKKWWFIKYLDENLARLLNGAADFVADPLATFAKASSNCGLCGRGLVDEVSRSRGIGPECHKRLEWFRNWYEWNKDRA